MSYQQRMINAIKLAIWNNETESLRRPLRGVDIPDEIQTMAYDRYQLGYEDGKAEGGGETLPDGDVMEFPLVDGSIGRVSTDSEYYDEIAILLTNSPDGINLPIKPSEMRKEIDQALTNAYGHGYNSGLTEGEAMGRKAQYDEFWDTYQKNPNQIIPPPKTNYKYMFGGAGWNSMTFKPKYDMIGSSFERTFHSSSIEEINVAVDMSGISSSTGCNQSFFGASSLRQILRFVPPPFAMPNAFTSCSSLEVISVDGTITEDINFSWSPKLNEATLSSIVDALAEVTVEKTLTLHPTAKSRLTNAQIATIDEKGWELAW